MIKYYILLIPSIFVLSCGTSLQYLGSRSSPTAKVDVFVDPSSIKKTYTIIGKAYVYRMTNTLQERAVEMAKEKGADAILFQDYFITEEKTAVYSAKTDSTGKRIAVRSSAPSPVVTSNQEILFLKYE